MHHMQWLLDISEGNLKYCGIFFFCHCRQSLFTAVLCCPKTIR